MRSGARSRIVFEKLDQWFGETVFQIDPLTEEPAVGAGPRISP